jgi:hypothetical protein
LTEGWREKISQQVNGTLPVSIRAKLDAGRRDDQEPIVRPAARPLKEALVADGSPFISFAVDDATAEYERLSELGVTFTQPPTQMGPVTMAVFDDTCENLIQIASPASVAASTEVASPPEGNFVGAKLGR